MPESPPDGPLPEDIDTATDEAPDYASIALYAALIPLRPVMAWGVED